MNDKNQSYLLSPKDMCTIEILPKLLQAGVYSLKIEGRMKRSEYAAGVTAIYRKYLDLYEKNPQAYRVEAEDMQELLDLYQRDGFNKGYYQVHNGKEMMAVWNQKEQNKKQNIQGKRNEVLFERLKKKYLDAKLQEKITGTLVLCADAPAVLDLDFKDTHVQVMGDTVEQAQRQPLTADRVKKQMEKTGQTPFAFEHLDVITDEDTHVQVMGDTVEQAQRQPLTADRVKKQMEKTGQTPFAFEHLDVITDEAGFLPMQSLNELRRNGLEKLEVSYLSKYRRQLPPKGSRVMPKQEEILDLKQKWYVSVEQKEQWEAALSQDEVDGIYCSISMYPGKNFLEEVLQDIETTHRAGKEYYLTLPYVLREGRLESRIQEMQEIGRRADGFVIRNLEELGYLKALGLEGKAVGDYSLYSFNDLSQEFLENTGLLRTTVPLELNGKEIRRKKLGLEGKAVGDYSLYSFNDLSQEFLENTGLLRTTVPLELNGKEIRRKNCNNSEMVVYGYYPMMVSAQCVKKTCGTCDHQSGTVQCNNSEMVVYGYYPMMVSAQCVKKTCGTCDHQSGTVQLKDRYGNHFMTKSFCDFCYTVIYNSVPTSLCVKKTCGTCDHQSGTVQLKDRYGNHFMTKSFCDFCYTVIYNSVPTSLLEEMDQINDAGVPVLRMNFTWESRKESKRLMELFVQKKKNAYKMQDITKGHFKRGVE